MASEEKLEAPVQPKYRFRRSAVAAIQTARPRRL
jgi:hypothetical protein